MDSGNVKHLFSIFSDKIFRAKFMHVRRALLGRNFAKVWYNKGCPCERGSGGPKTKNEGIRNVQLHHLYSGCSAHVLHGAAQPGASGITLHQRAESFRPGGGHVQSRHGAAYVLEFEHGRRQPPTALPQSRQQARLLPRARPVTLYYDPDDPEKDVCRGRQGRAGRRGAVRRASAWLLVLMVALRL